MGLKETLQPFSHLCLFVWVKVRIGLQSSSYIFMPQPFANEKWGEPHLDQQACMAVAEVMNSDNLDAAFLTASVHFVLEIVLCHHE